MRSNFLEIPLQAPISMASPWAFLTPRVRIIVRLAAQIAALWVISAGSSWLATALHLAVPGNVLGLCALFFALWSGIVRPEWLDFAGGLLTKHMAFFFIPITVGLMGFGATFARAGVAIVATLVISAAIGMLAAGHTTQACARRMSR
jgi:holin-like protein